MKKLFVLSALTMLVAVGGFHYATSDIRVMNDFIEEVNQNENMKAHMETVDGEHIVFVGYYNNDGGIETGEVFDIDEIKSLRD